MSEPKTGCKYKPALLPGSVNRPNFICDSRDDGCVERIKQDRKMSFPIKPTTSLAADILFFTLRLYSELHAASCIADSLLSAHRRWMLTVYFLNIDSMKLHCFHSSCQLSTLSCGTDAACVPPNMILHSAYSCYYRGADATNWSSSLATSFTSVD